MSPVDIVYLILILSALVVAHEWGHFIVARLFKIRVDDFSIGFGKRILRLGKLGDTEYNIRLLPLGGFVKIAGMDPDEEPIIRAKDAVLKRNNSDDPDSAEIPLIAENTSEGVAYDDPDGFNSKPLWQRSLVILAGPVMSFITGVVILCLMGWLFGLPIGKPVNRVVMVDPGGEGHRIGLQAGDRILDINGVPTPTGYDMVRGIQTHLGQSIHLTIDRDGRTFVRTATPKPYIDEDTGKPLLVDDVVTPGGLAAIGIQPGDRINAIANNDVNNKDDITRLLTKNAGRNVTIDVSRTGVIPTKIKGVIPTNIASEMPTINAHEVGVLHFQPDMAMVHMGPWTSIKHGFQMTAGLFLQLGQLIKQHKIHKSAGGIVRMAAYTEIARKDGIVYVLQLAAQISISLAIFNLLPIPILDGGHLLTFFIEWVRRGKKMSPQLQQAFLMTGLAIIVVLFCLITGNDILDRLSGHMQQ